VDIVRTAPNEIVFGFEPNDVGPEVGEQLPGPGDADSSGELEDAHPVESGHHAGLVFDPAILTVTVVMIAPVRARPIHTN
jgi:hypothetical protein